MPRPVPLVCSVLLYLLAALSAPAAEPPPPDAPLLGPSRVRSELRHVDGTDTDDLVGRLLPGEHVGAAVRARPGSSLRPDVRLLDPFGRDRTPPLRRSADGRRVSFRPLRIDLAGPWTLRIAAADGSEGAWEARVRLRRARSRHRTSLASAPARTLAIEACAHARLDLDVTAASAPCLEVVAMPDGDPLPSVAGATRRVGGRMALAGLPLAGGDGTWRILLDGGGPAVARWRLRPPPRPRGRIDLDPAEPRVDADRLPPFLVAGDLLRLHGRNFTIHPAPQVRLGGRPAAVLGAGTAGAWLDVVLPRGVAAGPAPLVVRNPDGQSTAAVVEVRPAFLPGPRPERFSPSYHRLVHGDTWSARLELSGMAPGDGLTVPLRVEGGAVAAPASVDIPPFGTAGTLTLRAVAPGTARVVAGDGRVAVLEIIVDPAPDTSPPPPEPETIDLSGWTLLQTGSTRSFVLPAGTVLVRGGSLVVGRRASRTAFVAFWSAAGTDWLYIDTGNRFPSINGGETFGLKDATGALVDGPSIVFGSGGVHERRPGTPAGDAAAWSTRSPTPANATPGAGPPSAGGQGVWISEVADPVGTGNWAYEYVEVHFDGRR